MMLPLDAAVRSRHHHQRTAISIWRSSNRPTATGRTERDPTRKEKPMPKASKSSASQTVEVEGYEGHFEDFGPYTVGFETYTADADMAPLFVGLPDDRCQCPHMGYVFEGKVKFTFADGHEEIYEAGDAYYAPPGHTPTLYAGSKVVEFSPTSELQQTMEVVEKNVTAGG